LTHPLEEGVVKNWEDMELIWDYGYKKVLNFINKNIS
jgi:actin-related protein 2